ncbi:MAG: four helix bundle protein [Chitinophagia bacterium]|nr:four helix bundle protein [Chitinophagia bacterium]
MFPYENLEVYRKAYAANQIIYRLLKGNKTIPGYAKDQLGRASLSIMLNIAEGSAKFSNKDRRNFYVTARGSTFECAALITFLADEGELTTELLEVLKKEYDSLSRMLFAMIKNLEE